MNDDNHCRICLDHIENVVQYCNCEGSTSPIHLECLEKWIKTSNNFTCEICHEEYRIDKKYTYCNYFNIRNILLLSILNIFIGTLYWICAPIVYKEKHTDEISNNIYFISLGIIIHIYFIHHSIKIYKYYEKIGLKIIANNETYDINETNETSTLI